MCISILHPPVDDPQSGELPSERWNPTQNVRSGSASQPLLLYAPQFILQKQHAANVYLFSHLCVIEPHGEGDELLLPSELG